MGPWFAAVGKAQLFKDVMNASSEKLEALLARMERAARAILVSGMTCLRVAIVEELSSKLAFWDHIPHKALGGFYGSCGGCKNASKQIIRECVKEYDDAIANGLGKRLHRVAHLMFSEDTHCRQDFDTYCESDDDLNVYPSAYVTLQE